MKNLIYRVQIWWYQVKDDLEQGIGYWDRVFRNVDWFETHKNTNWLDKNRNGKV